jgi:uncharacterized membrane protein
MAPTGRRPRDADALAALFGMAGMAHFVVPVPLRSVIPPWMATWARAVVAITGVAELAVSAALLHPATRRRGALGAAGLIAAFLVAHTDAAVRTRRDRPRWIERPAGVTVRLAVNTGYLAWALAVARGDRHQPSDERSTTRPASDDV